MNCKFYIADQMVIWQIKVPRCERFISFRMTSSVVTVMKSK